VFVISYPYGPFDGNDDMPEQVIDGSCALLGWELTNEAAAFTYIHLFDFGTDGGDDTIPVKSFGVPATMSANVPGLNIQFTWGLYILATTSPDPSGPAPASDQFTVRLNMAQPVTP